MFTKTKVAVFVDGCFWHGCKKCNKTNVKTNSDFWIGKIIDNQERDTRVNQQLLKMGWLPVRVWEHDVLKNVNECVERIRDVIQERTASRKQKQRTNSRSE